MRILALNAGSGTLRYKLLDLSGPGDGRELKGKLIDHVQGAATAEAAGRAVADCQPLGIDAVGCRVVHGGERYAAPARVTPDLVEYVRGLAPLAPLHVPTDLAVIEATARAAPGVPVVAVFDTAFHRTLPEVARRAALPDEVGPLARRYGFHGPAHQAVVGELLGRLGRDTAGTRLVSVHLGGGASACAVLGGQSVDTTMGLTPLDGLIMGTRCGAVDPGAVLALFRTGRTADQVEELLYRKSGLLGLSGRSGDLRDLEPAASRGDERAELALEVFAYRVRTTVGAFAAALGGLDAVGLSGALAENSAGLRARCLRGLEFLGVRIDHGRNGSAGPDAAARLTADASPVPAWLVPADEERQIAREVAALLADGPD